MALDTSSQKLYWADGWDDVIQRMDTAGTALETLLADMSAGDIVLDVPRHKMYWVGTDQLAGDLHGIWRANLTGSGIERVVPLDRHSSHIAVVAGID